MNNQILTLQIFNPMYMIYFFHKKLNDFFSLWSNNQPQW